MTPDLTRPRQVNLTPSGLLVPTFGPVDLTLVNPKAGQPVKLTPDPGHPVDPTPVNPTAPVNPTRPDPDPVEPTLTESPADAAAAPVNGSTGQADPLTQEPAGGWWTRRRARRAAAKAAPTQASAPAVVVAPAPNGNAAEPATKPKPKELPWWLNATLFLVMWGVTAIATYLASGGQISAAENMGITDHKKYLVPAGLELVAVALFLMGYVAGRAKFSPWPYWVGGFGVGGFAIYNVLEHSINSDQGSLFGAFSLGTLILWWAKLLLSLKKYRREAGHTSKGGLKFGLLWLDAPRPTMWASRFARQWQLDDIDLAMSYGELMVGMLDNTKDADRRAKRKQRAARDLFHDRYATPEQHAAARQQMEEAAEARLSRSERVRIARREVQKRAGRPVAELPSFADIERVTFVERKQPPQPAEAVAPNDPETIVEVEDVLPVWSKQISEGSASPRQRPTNAPVSPAPAGSGKDPFVRHAKAISMVMAHIDKVSGQTGSWKTRTDPIKLEEVEAAQPRNSKGEKITGKGTLLDIRWLIEMLSDRADQVPDEKYEKYGVSREGRAEA